MIWIIISTYISFLLHNIHPSKISHSFRIASDPKKSISVSLVIFFKSMRSGRESGENCGEETRKRNLHNFLILQNVSNSRLETPNSSSILFCNYNTSRLVYFFHLLFSFPSRTLFLTLSWIVSLLSPLLKGVSLEYNFYFLPAWMGSEAKK